ncbi:MAG: hypothetical protein J7L69_00700 [Desulfobulbaceae bacterium]|nr:hypothetical protein [Desulfobulbaceae bacterium]
MIGMISSPLKGHFVWISLVLLTACGLQAESTVADEMAIQSTRQLVTEVYQRGSVRVIVTLDVEGGVGADVQAIDKAQQALLADLSLFRVSKIKQYRSLPVLVLVVDPAALGYLLASPRVTAVNADAIARPISHLPGGDTQGRSNVYGIQ